MARFDTVRNRRKSTHAVAAVFVRLSAVAMLCLAGVSHAADMPDGAVVKKILKSADAGENLLKGDGWVGWQQGFVRQGDVFLCDNGDDSRVQRGASQTITLNQTRPEPIFASAWSKAEGVGGSRNNDYALYIDLVHTDGTPLWGRTDVFNVGTHDWQRAEVVIFPDKPVRSVSFHMLLRSHSGKAWFRDPQLRLARPPAGAALFDTVPVSIAAGPRSGFQLRDVAADGDFVRLVNEALGIGLSCAESVRDGTTFFDATLTDTTGRDRAISLIYAVKFPAAGATWLHDGLRSEPVEPARQYLNAAPTAAGAAGLLSRYPFAAVAGPDKGLALGIDMARPAVFRVGYNAGTEELFLIYDIGLTPERPSATVRFCQFDFDPAWGFRAALARYYETYPEAFHCRIPQQGLWMPFAKISEVAGWQDFGFRFKEGNNETAWDDEHGVLTFRYTEPMTWWMSMPKGMPRTLDAALAEARRLGDEKNDRSAKALFASGFHDEAGRFVAQLQDTPWCDGAVWSMNSMPAVKGDPTDFSNKWNADLRQRLYGPGASARLDGEYIDSSEGYVTAELDFRRDHFAAADTPLTFSRNTRQPAVLRGLIAFEYVRAIARDVTDSGGYMMANSTPSRLCWLAPLLDVLGTETDWNPGGRWQPMSHADLLYRRSLCGAKPYCFLMNTQFERFDHERVEKYMKRSLAYGMFPGFFSHNASQGHYFTRPELYNRDRDLFKKYVPLCRIVAEAGWRAVPGARCDNPAVRIERFGDRHLTVFNDGDAPVAAVIQLDDARTVRAHELVASKDVQFTDGRATIHLDGEDVAVVMLP